MLGIGCNFQQGLGRGTEQDGVDQLGVLQRQAADLRRERKHYVKIGRRQKLRLPLGEPFGAGRGLALRTMAIATRVIYVDAMSALITLLEMTAQYGGPAVTNISQRSSLLARQHRVPASEEILLMSADDIGQFQPMFFHRGDGTMSRSKESSGLAVERTAMSATCR
jgi:hypothetical protein